MTIRKLTSKRFILLISLSLIIIFSYLYYKSLCVNNQFCDSDFTIIPNFSETVDISENKFLGSNVCSWNDKIVLSSEKGIAIIDKEFRTVYIDGTEESRELKVIEDTLYYLCNQKIYAMDMYTYSIVEVFDNREYKMAGLTYVGDKIYGIKVGYNSFVGCVNIYDGAICFLEGTEYPVESIGYYNNEYYYIGGNSRNTIYKYNLQEKNEETVIVFDKVIKGSFIREDSMYIAAKTEISYNEMGYKLTSINLDNMQITTLYESSNSLSIRNDIDNKIIFSENSILYTYDLDTGDKDVLLAEYGGGSIYTVNDLIIESTNNRSSYAFYDKSGEPIYLEQ